MLEVPKIVHRCIALGSNELLVAIVGVVLRKPCIYVSYNYSYSIRQLCKVELVADV